MRFLTLFTIVVNSKRRIVAAVDFVVANRAVLCMAVGIGGAHAQNLRRIYFIRKACWKGTNLRVQLTFLDVDLVPLLIERRHMLVLVISDSHSQ